MQFEAFVHSSLPGHILWAKEALGQGSQAGWPQVRMLVERLCKRLGALEDTGQSTASVGVGASWKGLYIHVQMPVSRSQVPFFQEKVWKRRGALEFTGRSTASVGVCTSWRGTYTC